MKLIIKRFQTSADRHQLYKLICLHQIKWTAGFTTSLNVYMILNMLTFHLKVWSILSMMWYRRLQSQNTLERYVCSALALAADWHILTRQYLSAVAVCVLTNVRVFQRGLAHCNITSIKFILFGPLKIWRKVMSLAAGKRHMRHFSTALLCVVLEECLWRLLLTITEMYIQAVSKDIST